MFIKDIFFVITLICTIFIVKDSYASPKFVPGINGLPLMTGLVLMPDSHVVFDTLDGRIIEVLADGRIHRNDILTFYKDTLPQLGWKLNSKNEYERDGELLKIRISLDKMSKAIVRFFIISLAK
jgi:hypothetical protein